jgi:DNA-binding LacI/PurR family transcriptional regulator
MALETTRKVTLGELKPRRSLSVAGLDGIPEPAYPDPALSTALTHPDVVETGAAERALRKIATPRSADERPLIAPPLISGET